MVVKQLFFQGQEPIQDYPSYIEIYNAKEKKLLKWVRFLREPRNDEECDKLKYLIHYYNDNLKD